jgi:hypothetical protein
MTFLKDNPEFEFARTLQRNLKQLFKRKKRSYEKLRGMRLCKMAKANPAGFWRRYRAQKEAAHGIKREALWQGFAALLVPPSSPPDLIVPAPASDVDGCTLSQDIQLCEIVDAIKTLKRGKAAGLDGVKVEFVIDGCDALLRILQTLFNKLLSKGFCSSLVVGVIHALFKSGDASSVDNYRGITVGPVIAKLFAMVLESRLNSWAECKGIRARGQAGFRQDYPTMDNLFVLQTLIDSRTCWPRKKLYTCFVDFRKAFDTMPREKLWRVLEGIGVGGRFLTCLRSMYSQD